MKTTALIFISFSILSCQRTENKSKNYSINQASRPILELKNLVIDKGDSTAYYELYYDFVDKDEQNKELLYYAYIMAFKYNYPKAYMDVFN